MHHNPVASPSSKPPWHFSLADLIGHFRTVGKISLYVALLTALCLLVAVYYLAGTEGGSYLAIFDAHTLTKKQLLPALLIAGAVLVVVAGVITWMVVLYSTIRVAGPLYPLSRSLEGLILDGSAPVRSRRQEDALSEEYMLFAGGAKRVQYHYDSLHEMVELALAQLELPEPDLGAGLTQTINKLRELDRLVQL
ncbi:MAG: hypothetical protein HQL88_03335 [Magnetococcales bacterium]|nr:hypothetical protein [Magnetococcales bacterium]